MATADDLEGLQTLFVSMAQGSAYLRDIPLSQVHLEGVLRHWLANVDACCWVAETGARVFVGVLALLVYAHLTSGERMAAEACWWVEPAWRGRVGADLLAQGEAWARARGAMTMQMVAPDERFERFYARRRYVPMSRTYERRWSCRG